VATQAIQRGPVEAPSGPGNSLPFLVYITALVLGIAALLIGLFTHSLTPRGRGAFCLLGSWAIVSAFIAFFYRGAERELGVELDAPDARGKRLSVWARIGVEGWSAWAIVGLLAACVIGIIGGWR
jgi:hypothetical protein